MSTEYDEARENGREQAVEDFYGIEEQALREERELEVRIELLEREVRFLDEENVALWETLIGIQSGEDQ
jgi:hypothetical protein